MKMMVMYRDEGDGEAEEVHGDVVRGLDDGEGEDDLAFY